MRPSGGAQEREGHEGRVEQRLLGRSENGIVAIRQRPPTWQDGAIAIVSDRLEFPLAAAVLQVTHMCTARCEHPMQALVDPDESQATRHPSCSDDGGALIFDHVLQ